MKKSRRKPIQIDIYSEPKGTFNLGLNFSLENFEKNIEYPQYNVKHGHLTIDIGFWFINITFMDLKEG